MVLAGASAQRFWNPQLPGPTLLLPLAGETLLARQCRWLHGHGVRHVMVLSCEDPGGELRAERPAGSLPGIEIHWRHEEIRQGTAGSLRAARDFVGRDPFLVLHQNFVPAELDLSRLLHSAWPDDTSMKVLVRELPPDCHHAVSLDGDGSVIGFPRHHLSRERRSNAVCREVYLCGPEVFDWIPPSGYVDLKEQLVPALVRAGRRVQAVPSTDRSFLLDGPEDYLLALDHLMHEGDFPEGFEPIGEKVWARGRVELAPSVHLVGPVLLDAGVNIDEEAQIVGPVFLGPGARVGKSALVRDAAIWSGSSIGERARVESSVIAEEQWVAPGEELGATFRCERDARIEDRPVSSSNRRVLGKTSSGRFGERRMFWRCKRCIDVMVAFVGLLVSAPLFALIAIAIRLDSRGPTFYREKRCGRFGREFWIVKFRTMYANAAERLSELRGDSEREGPMFKLSRDPRVTRVGEFLRRTSLDELPQLWNILKGEMSLVGPRPLSMEEMAHAPQWRDLRLSVRPGLAGSWQLYARDSRRFDDWIRHDLAYVLGPPTLVRDLRIFARTAFAMLTGASRGE